MLRHRISIQRLNGDRDAHNQPVDVWEEVCSRRASIEPLNGKEFIISGAENSEISARITLRYESLLSGISAKNRVVHGAVIYEIVSPPITALLTNGDIILMCKEVN